MKKYVPVIAFSLAAALFAFGLAQGQEQLVMTKAVHVCLECIGVG